EHFDRAGTRNLPLLRAGLPPRRRSIPRALREAGTLTQPERLGLRKRFAPERQQRKSRSHLMWVEHALRRFPALGAGPGRQNATLGWLPGFGPIRYRASSAGGRRASPRHAGNADCEL